MYLVEVDDGLPEGVGLLVEVPHTNLTEVTGMVLFALLLVSSSHLFWTSLADRFVVSGGYRSNLVHVGTVVVLTTSQTTTSGMLAVLAYTALAGGDMAATIETMSAFNYQIIDGDGAVDASPEQQFHSIREKAI